MSGAKAVTVSNAAEALDLLRKLASQGPCVFRGQTKPWPVVPPLLRQSTDQDKARRRLEEFLSWCGPHPRMSLYAGDRDQLTGIAQHYGVATSFVDLTTVPEVAIFFATQPTASDNEPTIFVWQRADLLGVPGVRPIEPKIPNLWRLEGQGGLFVDVAADVQLDLLATHVVTFPSPSSDDNLLIRHEDVYPSRKSPLETVLDDFFFREDIENVVSKFNPALVLRRRWQSNAGAFRNREIQDSPLADSTLELWMSVESVVPYRDVATDRRFTLQCNVRDLEATARCIKDGLAKPRPRYGIPVFVVCGFKDSRIDSWASRMMNYVFDGVTSLPYSAQSISTCMVNLLNLLPSIESISEDAVRTRFEGYFGSSTDVTFSASGAFPTGALVSTDRLRSCLNQNSINQLRPFYRRMIQHAPEKFLCLDLDPLHSMLFEPFQRLFIEEAIPSQAAYGCVAALEAAGGDEEIKLPNMAFDPLSLAFFGLDEYQWGPLVFESNPERLILLWAGMTDEDVCDEVVTAGLYQREHPNGFVLRVIGYEPPLRKSPEAMSLIRTFADLGGLSLLEASSQMNAKPEDYPLLPLGAFEAWRMLRLPAAEPPWDQLKQDFIADYFAGNKTLDEVIQKAGGRTSAKLGDTKA